MSPPTNLWTARTAEGAGDMFLWMLSMRKKAEKELKMKSDEAGEQMTGVREEVGEESEEAL